MFLTFLFKMKNFFKLKKIVIGKKYRVGRRFVLNIGDEIVKFGDYFGCRNDVSFTINNCGELKLGNHVFFNNFCSIVCLSKIEIGSYCLFGENVKNYDHNHIYGTENIYTSGLEYKNIVIGNNVWICSNVVICAGVKIGNNCVIGANSVVYKDVPNNHILFSNGALKQIEQKE